MSRDSTRFVGVLVLGSVMGACAQSSPEQGELQSTLIELGFMEVPERTFDGPEDSSATFYYNDDGRTALLVSEVDGTEWNGFIFADGELQSTLEEQDVAYCPNCYAAWASCLGFCTTWCWASYGTGSGCYSDCSASCNYYYNKCAQALSQITGGCYL